MKAFIWFAFVLLSAAWTGLAALTVKASDWLLGTVASVHGGEALGNAVKQPLPEALAPWINPVWLAAPREFLLGALQMAEQFAPSPEHMELAWFTLGFVPDPECAERTDTWPTEPLGLHWLAGRLPSATAGLDLRS